MSEATAPATAPATTQAAPGTTQAPTTTAAPAATTTPAPAKTEPTTTSAAPAPTKVVPEKYDLKMPEGSHLDTAHRDKVASFAKERGLSQEEAQSVLDRDHANLAAYLEGTKTGLKTQAEGWIKELSVDKEIGGEAFKKNVELSSRFTKKFFSEPFLKMLDDTGLGNHPELVRGFVRAAKAMGEDSLVLPGVQAGGKPSLEDKFYPSHKQQ